MRKNPARGFTLIELLIVIALIAALSAISVMTYTGAQKRARDAQRRSDLKQYQIGLEAYAVKIGTYPQTTEAVHADTLTVLNLSSYPLDPKSNNPNYGYYYYSTPNGYGLYATLEIETTGAYILYCSNGNNSDSFDESSCP